MDRSLKKGCRIAVEYVRGTTEADEIWISRIIKFSIDEYGDVTLYNDYDTLYRNVVRKDPNKSSLPGRKIGQFLMLMTVWWLDDTY